MKKPVLVISILAPAAVGIVLLSLWNHDNDVNTPPEHLRQIEIANLSIPTNDIGSQNEQSLVSTSEAPSREPESPTTLFEATFGNPDVLGQVNQILYDELVTTVGSSDADFIAGLAKLNDWEQIKARINSRGGNNSELLMRYGLRSGQISANEIVELARSGAEVPDSAILNLVGTLPIDEVLSLRNQGVPIDLTYQNPFSGKNALGQFIMRAGASPEKYKQSEVTDTLRKLISTGVEFNPQGVEQTPLDYALKRVNTNNAEQKIAAIKVLLEHGVVFEQRHKELVDRMPSGPGKDQLLALF